MENKLKLENGRGIQNGIPYKERFFLNFINTTKLYIHKDSYSFIQTQIFLRNFFMANSLGGLGG